MIKTQEKLGALPHPCLAVSQLDSDLVYIQLMWEPDIHWGVCWPVPAARQNELSLIAADAILGDNRTN